MTDFESAMNAFEAAVGELESSVIRSRSYPAQEETQAAESRALALAALAVTLQLANRELQRGLDDGDSPEAAAAKRDRVRKVLQRWFKAVADLAAEFKAEGYAITVGIPVKVEITFDWEVQVGS